VESKIFCDSDWAGDPETRISVTGFVIYLLNVPISWCSKAQKGVTLTEAEDVAISEAVKEIRFVYYLLNDIHVQVKIPIIVKTDNVGAIFMSENASTGVRTRHVDTRYHFVREFIEGGFIKIEFVRSVENDSDVFTKNVSQELCEKHTKNFLVDSADLGLVDRYGIGRVLKISLPITPFSFTCLGYPLGIFIFEDA
jgi:hypothetical protein